MTYRIKTSYQNYTRGKIKLNCMHTIKRLLRFKALAIIYFVMVNAAYAGKADGLFQLSDSANAVINPGFEKSLGGTWQISNIMGGAGKCEPSTTVKRNGKYALKLSKTNSVGYVQLSTKTTVRVLPGQVFTFRFWFNSSNAQITSFLIPRLVANNNFASIANPSSGLWVDFDYDSQSLMRNSPSTQGKDWVKRVVYHENKTAEPQDIYLQVMLYGNPFDVYVDDFEFMKGKVKGTNEPANPPHIFTEAAVAKILAGRSEESARVSGTGGTTKFEVNGKNEWPIFYRSMMVERADPGGFGAQGIHINNVVLPMLAGSYSWPKYQSAIMSVLRKNPKAKLLLELDMNPDSTWIEEHPTANWITKTGRKLYVGTYSSLEWRLNGTNNIKQLVADMKANGFWKIVVGANVVGGHDWQFWTKAIGEYAADYSEGNRKAWQLYLLNLYDDIGVLNKTWNTSYKAFDEIAIPDPSAEGETLPAIMPRGAVPDFRQFCEASAFDLRETFAKALKEEAGKNIFVGAYGMPMENQHLRFLNMAQKTGKANDIIASMSYYPYRQPGFASGYHPEQSFGFHNTGFMQELDLRYYTSNKSWYDELSLMWCGSQANITDWRNMHRKLVGISLAQNQGFWYYDMDKQFVAKEVLQEIGKVKKIADALTTKNENGFRPDVCVVRFGAESRYYGSSVDNAVGATVQWQYMQLETSGVPFDVHYLSDVMAESKLKDYKIYIFHNNSYLSNREKDWISENLKSKGRTLIWIYDNGYVTDGGLSSQSVSELTGMEVKTAEDYTRSVAIITGQHHLVGGTGGYLKVPAFQGMAEALCGIFTKEGPSQTISSFPHKWGYMVAPGVSRYQKFWIVSGYDAALAKYSEDGKTSIAVKQFKDWTSIYIAAPNALAGEMMNNIAKQAGAYRYGTAAMGEVRMSGRFVSYHALKSGKYLLRLPKVSKVIDADTGKVLAAGVTSFVIDGKAQNTYWYFIE
jgi:hypothetical protein